MAMLLVTHKVPEKSLAKDSERWVISLKISTTLPVTRWDFSTIPGAQSFSGTRGQLSGRRFRALPDGQEKSGDDQQKDVWNPGETKLNIAYLVTQKTSWDVNFPSTM